MKIPVTNPKESTKKFAEIIPDCYYRREEARRLYSCNTRRLGKLVLGCKDKGYI